MDRKFECGELDKSTVISILETTAPDGKNYQTRYYNLDESPDAPAGIIKNWMRSKNTIELLGLWEKSHNPKFKLVEFDRFKNEAGYNHFVLSLKKWITAAAAIGLQSQSDRYGGTYAHIDI